MAQRDSRPPQDPASLEHSERMGERSSTSSLNEKLALSATSSPVIRVGSGRIISAIRASAAGRLDSEYRNDSEYSNQFEQTAGVQQNSGFERISRLERLVDSTSDALMRAVKTGDTGKFHLAKAGEQLTEALLKEVPSEKALAEASRMLNAMLKTEIQGLSAPNEVIKELSAAAKDFGSIVGDLITGTSDPKRFAYATGKMRSFIKTLLELFKKIGKALLRIIQMVRAMLLQMLNCPSKKLSQVAKVLLSYLEPFVDPLPQAA